MRNVLILPENLDAIIRNFWSNDVIIGMMTDFNKRKRDRGNNNIMMRLN